MITTILTDIEGTTTSLSFVKETLFPYSARMLPDFLRSNAHLPEVSAIIDQIGEYSRIQRPSIEQCITILLGWIEADQKITPLKHLQGLLWRRGYEQGHFTGHLYPDAAQYLRVWKERGLTLGVFSSGSIEAQQLLFRWSNAGDMTPVFSHYFDTTTGPKREAESYRTISRVLEASPHSILFLSDIEAELDAAKEAGMSTILVSRKGELPRSSHSVVKDFTEIEASFPHAETYASPSLS